MNVRLLHLFPRDLSASGDSGNVQTVAFRLGQSGHDVEIISWDGEGTFPESCDSIFIGNGPWSAALRVQPTLSRHKDALTRAFESGVPVVAIGAGAELLSKQVIDGAGVASAGIGIFPFTATREVSRRVGYMRVNSADGVLIGFGDFASAWVLDEGASPLGQAVVGDQPDKPFSEGCRVGTSFASRMGGPILPLNPALADRVISDLLARRGQPYEPHDLPVDEYIRNARAVIEKNQDSAFTTIAL